MMTKRQHVEMKGVSASNEFLAIIKITGDVHV